jgi:hypothetical protein
MARLVSTAVLVALVGASSAAPATAATITLLTGAGRSGAGDGAGGLYDTNVVAFASPPFSSGPITATDAGASSTTTYTFTNAAWLIEFAHARPGNGSGTYVWSDDYYPGAGVTFSVSEPVVALLSGAYTVVDTGAGDNVTYDVKLWANGYSTLLHETYNYSAMTPNESFVLGQSGGDQYNSVTGGVDHVLVPGVTYALEWYVVISDGHRDPGDIGASATGFYRIDFLPEPPMAALLAAGCVGLAWIGRRRAGSGLAASESPLHSTREE